MGYLAGERGDVRPTLQRLASGNPTEVGHSRVEKKIIVPSYTISLEMTYFHIYLSNDRKQGN